MDGHRNIQQIFLNKLFFPFFLKTRQKFLKFFALSAKILSMINPSAVHSIFFGDFFFFPRLQCHSSLTFMSQKYWQLLLSNTIYHAQAYLALIPFRNSYSSHKVLFPPTHKYTNLSQKKGKMYSSDPYMYITLWWQLQPVPDKKKRFKNKIHSYNMRY